MPVTILLFVFAFIIGIVVLAMLFSPAARMKRALAEIPPCEIAQAGDGATVKLLGQVEILGEPLVAPLSGRPCAYYEVTVQEHRRRGKHSHWVTIITEVDGRDFVLRDGTGKAVVRIQSAARNVVLHKDASFSSGTFNDAAAHLEAFLNKHGRQSQGWVFNKSLRYTEGVIEAGETVVAAGAGRWEPDPEPDPGTAGGYREAPRRLTIGPAGEMKLLVSDDPSVLQLQRARTA